MPSRLLLWIWFLFIYAERTFIRSEFIHFITAFKAYHCFWIRLEIMNTHVIHDDGTVAIDATHTHTLTPSSLRCFFFCVGSIKNVWIITALENNKRFLLLLLSHIRNVQGRKKKRKTRSRCGCVHVRPIKPFHSWEKRGKRRPGIIMRRKFIDTVLNVRWCGGCS